MNGPARCEVGSETIRYIVRIRPPALLDIVGLAKDGRAAGVALAFRQVCHRRMADVMCDPVTPATSGRGGPRYRGKRRPERDSHGDKKDDRSQHASPITDALFLIGHDAAQACGASRTRDVYRPASSADCTQIGPYRALAMLFGS
jgi:hypothetical protein